MFVVWNPFIQIPPIYALHVKDHEKIVRPGILDEINRDKKTTFGFPVLTSPNSLKKLNFLGETFYVLPKS